MTEYHRKWDLVVNNLWDVIELIRSFIGRFLTIIIGVKTYISTLYVTIRCLVPKNRDLGPEYGGVVYWVSFLTPTSLLSLVLLGQQSVHTHFIISIRRFLLLYSQVVHNSFCVLFNRTVYFDCYCYTRSFLVPDIFFLSPSMSHDVSYSIQYLMRLFIWFSSLNYTFSVSFFYYKKFGDSPMSIRQPYTFSILLPLLIQHWVFYTWSYYPFFYFSNFIRTFGTTIYMFLSFYIVVTCAKSTVLIFYITIQIVLHSETHSTTHLNPYVTFTFPSTIDTFLEYLFTLFWTVSFCVMVQCSSSLLIYFFLVSTRIISSL